MNITETQYWSEVSELAASVVTEAASYLDCITIDSFDADAIRDTIYDTVLHETIDGHQWVIYYAYNLDILRYSDNADYMVDEFGAESAGEALKDKGLSGLHMALAFWALYADVSDRISDAIESYEEALNNAS